MRLSFGTLYDPTQPSPYKGEGNTFLVSPLYKGGLRLRRERSAERGVMQGVNHIPVQEVIVLDDSTPGIFCGVTSLE